MYSKILILAIFGLVLISGCISNNGENNSQYQLGVKQCDSFGCMSVSAKNCESAGYAGSLSETDFGATLTLTNYYEIKGMDSGKCVLYLRVIKNTIEYSQDFIDQLLAAGLSPAEIDAQFEKANTELLRIEGLDGQCKFETSELSDMFASWEAGDLSSGIYDGVDCGGDFFPEHEDD